MYAAGVGKLRAGLLLSLAILYTACHSWQVAGPTPASYVTAHAPDSIRVMRKDSTRVTLRNPRVQGDTLVGYLTGAQRPGGSPEEVVVPSEQILRAEVYRSDGMATAGLVVGIFALTMALSAAAYCGSGGLFGTGC
jgi:hypothetical protein